MSSIPRKARCWELPRQCQVQKKDLPSESQRNILSSCISLRKWFPDETLDCITYENPFAWKRPDLVSTAVFRVPGGTQQSSVGTNGTLSTTWGYSKNFSAHQLFMTSYVNIDYILQGHATMFSCSKPHRPTESEQDTYASKSNASVLWNIPEVPPLRLCRLASHDSVWSSPFPIGPALTMPSVRERCYSAWANAKCPHEYSGMEEALIPATKER